MSILKHLSLCFLLLPLVALADTRVAAIRASASANQARIVIVTTGPLSYQLFELESPARLVVDLKNTNLNSAYDSQGLNNNFMSALRTSKQPQALRLVFDLKKSVQYESFVSASGNTRRLIIDLTPCKAPKASLSAPQFTSAAAAKANIPKAMPVVTSKIVQETKSTGRRDIVVVIDPGHGGKDTGAIGQRRTYEKNDVLAISKQLQTLINRQNGFRAVLTRNRDYYLTLRQRLAIARQYKADMFIAIHADAFRNHQAHGASVYALSERGATSEAALWLAEQENESELMGGVELNDKDNMLKSVLLNLSQTATIQSGLTIGHQLLNSMSRVCPLHHRKVEQAAFVVLKSPDIPSVLVECGFISNWQEEAKLKDPRFQYALASALTQGLVMYFKMNPPHGTWLAQQRK